MSPEARRQHWIPWCWSYRCLWGTWCGCWQLDAQVFLKSSLCSEAAEPSLQLQHCVFNDKPILPIYQSFNMSLVIFLPYVVWLSEFIFWAHTLEVRIFLGSQICYFFLLWQLSPESLTKCLHLPYCICIFEFLYLTFRFKWYVLETWYEVRLCMCK